MFESSTGFQPCNSPSDVRCPTPSLREDTASKETFSLAPTVCVPTGTFLDPNAAFAIWFRSSGRSARFPNTTGAWADSGWIGHRQLLPESPSGVPPDSTIGFLKRSHACVCTLITLQRLTQCLVNSARRHLSDSQPIGFTPRRGFRPVCCTVMCIALLDNLYMREAVGRDLVGERVTTRLLDDLLEVKVDRISYGARLENMSTQMEELIYGPTRTL